MPPLKMKTKQFIYHLRQFLEFFCRKHDTGLLLPDDVLRDIFILSLPTSHNSVLSVHHPPLLFLRVCRNWNLVALDTPALWASMHLVIPTLAHSTDTGPRKQENIKLRFILSSTQRLSRQWLIRSGKSPLQVSISYRKGVKEQENSWRTLIDTVIGFSHRLQTLDLEFPQDGMKRILDLDLSPDDFPLLHSLKLTWDYMPRSSTDTHWRKCGLFRAPNLRSVQLVNTPTNPTLLPLNWTQLTHLSIKHQYNGEAYFTLKNLMFIFRTCHNLSSLSLVRDWFATRGPIMPTNYEDAPDLTICPHLCRLSMFDVPSISYAPLNFPSLRRLDLFQNPGEPTTNILSLFVSTMGSIRHLVTNPCVTTQAELITWLRCCPRLEVLSLVEGPVLALCTYKGIEQTFLQLLTRKSETLKGTDEYFCPNLTHFECLVGSAFSDRNLLDFVKEKQSQKDPNIRKLAHVIVFFGRYPDSYLDLPKELDAFNHRVDFRFDLRYNVFRMSEAHCNSEVIERKHMTRHIYNPFAGLDLHDDKEINLGVFGGSLRLSEGQSKQAMLG